MKLRGISSEGLGRVRAKLALTDEKERLAESLFFHLQDYIQAGPDEAYVKMLSQIFQPSDNVYVLEGEGLLDRDFYSPEMETAVARISEEVGDRIGFFPEIVDANTLEFRQAEQKAASK